MQGEARGCPGRAARNILVAVPDRREENPDPARRLLVPVKNNLAPLPPPLAYSIRTGRIHWLSETELPSTPTSFCPSHPLAPAPTPSNLTRASLGSPPNSNPAPYPAPSWPNSAQPPVIPCAP